MTSCAPIIHYQDGFAGAVCIDIDPKGELKEYYDFDPTYMPTHLTFNSDEAFDSRENMDDS